MTAKTTPNPQSPRESGTEIHRRESRLQIYLPYGIGLLILLTMVLVVALPTNPIWRVRAQAIADWTYTILCLIPMVLCVFPLFMLVALGIWGMYRLHGITEPPLRKLENLAAGLATRINNASEYVQRKTIDVSTTIEPALNLMNTFDNPQQEVSDATTE
jgi:hypothetical protein